jgi:hypothetical protein
MGVTYRNINVKHLNLVSGGSFTGFGDQIEAASRTYYVNNITGASGNNGLSWAKAFDQVDTAITAGEAYIDTYATNNQYCRYRIIIQGTATAYEAISAFPNYCDVIGIGADPRGNGAGIARLDGAGAADAAAGTCRGVNWYNLQFTGSGNYYAMDVATSFRSRWENCAFVNCAYGGMRIVTGGGLVIRDCHFGGDTTTPATGLYIGSGSHNGNFNQCLVENNMIYGSTNGVLIDTYLNDGTRFHNNTIYGGTYGIRDTSTETTIAGNAFYSGNYAVGGTTGISIASTGNGAYQCVGNWVVDAGTADWLTTIAKS